LENEFGAFKVMSSYSYELRDFQANILGNMAIATFIIHYQAVMRNRTFDVTSRVTSVLTNKTQHGKWSTNTTQGFLTRQRNNDSCRAERCNPNQHAPLLSPTRTLTRICTTTKNQIECAPSSCILFLVDLIKTGRRIKAKKNRSSMDQDEPIQDFRKTRRLDQLGEVD
jgi:hypothetical protein